MKKILFVVTLVLIISGSIFYFVTRREELFRNVVVVPAQIGDQQGNALVCITFPEGFVLDRFEGSTDGLQPALVTNIDYTKKTITFDYIQNVRWVEHGDSGGLEYDNTNSLLRTFKFDNDTTIHSGYLPIKSWIEDPCTHETRYEFYNLETMREIAVKEGLEYYLSAPFVWVKLEGDVVKDIAVQYES